MKTRVMQDSEINVFKEKYPDLLSQIPMILRAVENIVKLFKNKGILYICGNGGSYADAIHIKGELGKSFICKRKILGASARQIAHQPAGPALSRDLEIGFPVIVLGESHSLRTAFSNDVDPMFIYAQELLSFVHFIRPGLLLGISTSGNAKNVLHAISVAKAYRVQTLGLTGPDGGMLSKVSDIIIKVPGKDTAAIQENHLPVYHLICKLVEVNFFKNLK